jgi:hypothetical protein
MRSHHHLTDIEFEKQFISGKLDADLFNHEAHLRLAWIYITKYGIESAVNSVPKHIQNFALHAGAPQKFNKTLTIAATRAVYHFMLKSTSDNFFDFVMEFPQLKYGFKALIQSHYNVDIFRLERAKQEFIEPDLMPFD